jgi:hypothetical protein
MKCLNCGQDLERFPASYDGEECPTPKEIERDSKGLPTRWSGAREKLRQKDPNYIEEAGSGGQQG